MRNAFKPGAHVYRGKSNNRAQRLQSKIRVGIKPVRGKIWRAIAQQTPNPAAAGPNAE